MTYIKQLNQISKINVPINKKPHSAEKVPNQEGNHKSIAGSNQ